MYVIVKAAGKNYVKIWHLLAKKGGPGASLLLYFDSWLLNQTDQCTFETTWLEARMRHRNFYSVLLN